MSLRVSYWLSCARTGGDFGLPGLKIVFVLQPSHELCDHEVASFYQQASIHQNVMTILLISETRISTSAHISKEMTESLPIAIDEEASIFLFLRCPGTGELCSTTVASFGKDILIAFELAFADFECDERHTGIKVIHCNARNCMIYLRLNDQVRLSM